MKYERSMVALFIGIFCMPFLLGFMFYMMSLSQQHKLNWEGFITTLWVGPYFAVGALICIIACGLSLYWLRTDKIAECDCADISDSSTSKRISHTISITDRQWQKFQSLGGAEWLDRVIDDA